MLLTVFQNRRWDSDHLTLPRLLADGRLGNVIRYEAEARFERWLRASAVTAAPGPRLRVPAFVCSDPDSQEDRLRTGARPDNSPGWGIEPETRWGRLVTGEVSVPMPSERGDWPRFYTLLRGSLLAADPPPVDPRDAVATLGILELARQSAADHSVMPVPV